MNVPYSDGHWEVSYCPHDKERLHIRNLHTDEGFPECWSIVSVRHFLGFLNVIFDERRKKSK